VVEVGLYRFLGLAKDLIFPGSRLAGQSAWQSRSPFED
jgi:hypothetical protein